MAIGAKCLILRARAAGSIIHCCRAAARSWSCRIIWICAINRQPSLWSPQGLSATCWRGFCPVIPLGAGCHPQATKAGRQKPRFGVSPKRRSSTKLQSAIAQQGGRIRQFSAKCHIKLLGIGTATFRQDIVLQSPRPFHIKRSTHFLKGSKCIRSHHL